MYGSSVTGGSPEGSIESTVSISGVVEDGGGGAVENVTVLAVDQSSDTTHTTVTDSNGVYEFVDLPVATYHLYTLDYTSLGKPYIEVS